jgi:hypothetical protein
MSSVPPPLPSLAQPVDPAWAQALRSRLRVPSEKWAKFLCVSIGPLAFLAVFYVLGAFPDFGKAVGPMVGTSLGAAIMASYWFNVRAARVRGNAILVSAEHWPELHALVQESQARLGLQGLKAYVVQDLVLEQAGMRLGGDDCLLLRSSMVDTALMRGDLDVLRFHIGRKCGQIAFGHYRWSSHSLAALARIVYPLYAWYRRCQERSADRAGLWVSGRRPLAHQGLAVLAAGVQIGGRLTPAAARAQLRETKHGLWITLVGWHAERVFYPQRIVNLDDAAKELGVGD